MRNSRDTLSDKCSIVKNCEIIHFSYKKIIFCKKIFNCLIWLWAFLLLLVPVKCWFSWTFGAFTPLASLSWYRFWIVFFFSDLIRFHSVFTWLCLWAIKLKSLFSLLVTTTYFVNSKRINSVTWEVGLTNYQYAQSDFEDFNLSVNA